MATKVDSETLATRWLHDVTEMDVAEHALYARDHACDADTLARAVLRLAEERDVALHELNKAVGIARGHAETIKGCLTLATHDIRKLDDN